MTPETPLPYDVGIFGPKLAATLTLHRIRSGQFAAPRGRRVPPYAPPPPPQPIPHYAPTRRYDRGAAGFAGFYGILGLPFFQGVQALHKGPPVIRNGTVGVPYGFAAYIQGKVQSFSLNSRSWVASGPLYTPQQLMAMLPPDTWPAVLPEWAQPVAPQPGTAPLVSLG